MSASTAPPRPIQQRFLRKLHSELANKTDVFEFAVSKEWAGILKQFVESEENATCEVPPLYSSDWDEYNMYVGEKNWIILASWYGIEGNYSFRRRPSMPGYINILDTAGKSDGAVSGSNYILADNRLDFLIAHCCLLQDLSSEKKKLYINIYFWESLEYIEFQLRCILKVNPETDVRMWMSLSDDGGDVLLEDLHQYDQHHISLGTILCQKYPGLFEILRKRQTSLSQYPAPLGVGQVPTKEDLSTVFVAHEWQLTLCLEPLSSSTQAKPFTVAAQSTKYAVPKVFRNVSLDNVFQTGRQHADWDKELKRLLDESMSSFNTLLVDQRDKVQNRTEQLLKTARQKYQVKEQEVDTRMEAAAVQESRLATREKEHNEREHELNSKLAKFKAMLTEFLTNKEKFEKDASKLAEQNAITASKVELNVGGVRYTTSVKTLLKEEGSTLQSMFSGQHALTPDTDGSYFIDRDGTHFRHVLNFLRDGPASVQHLPSSDMRLLSELRTEAEHYQMFRMAEVLRSKILEGKAGGDFVSLPSR